MIPPGAPFLLNNSRPGIFAFGQTMWKRISQDNSIPVNTATNASA
jgi:hypothetical protein